MLTFNFQGGSSEEAIARALDCVTESIAAGAPFVLIHNETGADSGVRIGYAWPGGDSDVFSLRQSYGLGATAQLEQHSCKTLVRTEACQPGASNLCLSCEQASTPQSYCGEG